jgi:hypothetical protein
VRFLAGPSGRKKSAGSLDRVKSVWSGHHMT